MAAYAPSIGYDLNHSLPIWCDRFVLNYFRRYTVHSAIGDIGYTIPLKFVPVVAHDAQSSPLHNDQSAGKAKVDVTGQSLFDRVGLTEVADHGRGKFKFEIQGTVRNPDGSVAKDAAVLYSSFGEEQNSQIIATAKSTSDANGHFALRFSMKERPTGPIQLLVVDQKNRLAWHEPFFPPGVETLSVPLTLIENSGEVSGTLVARDNTPVSNLTVRVKGFAGNPEGLSSMLYCDENLFDLSTKTNESGQFIIGDVPTGLYAMIEIEDDAWGMVTTVVARSEDSSSEHSNAPNTLTGKLAIYGPAARIPVFPKVQLLGKVIDLAGKSVQGAKVNEVATTDAAGGFELSVLNLSSASGSGHPEWHQAIYVRGPENTPLVWGYVRKLPPGGRSTQLDVSTGQSNVKVTLPSNVTPIAISASPAGTATTEVDTQNPTSARDFYVRGHERESSKQFKEALADYKKASDLDPGFFDAYFSRSSLCAELKDYHGAIEALTGSLKARPNDYSALFNLGLYYEYLREYDDAIAYYTRALADDTDFSHYGGSKNKAKAAAYHYRGRVYQWYKQDNVKAVADYTEALRLNPDIEMVRYRRARAYHDLKEYAKANADYVAARDIDPNYPNLLNAWAWQLATCPDDEYRDGDGQLALQLANQTKDLDILAAAYAETGAFEDAVTSQKLAIEQLDQLPEPKEQAERERRQKQRMEMQTRLAAYEARRPYRDE